MMKKIFTIFLALTMAVGLLAGCGKKNNAETGESDSNKLSVVTTIFPEYDWVREILGDKAESTDLTMLLDNGVDLHSYQPTADDIVKISDCDLFVYVGGESDGWVESVLKNAVNKNDEGHQPAGCAGRFRKNGGDRRGDAGGRATPMTTARRFPPLKIMRFRTEACPTGRAAGSLPTPLLLDGTLDDAFAAMAEEGEMTADEYKTYYQKWLQNGHYQYRH